MLWHALLASCLQLSIEGCIDADEGLSWCLSSSGGSDLGHCKHFGHECGPSRGAGLQCFFSRIHTGEDSASFMLKCRKAAWPCCKLVRGAGFCGQLWRCSPLDDFADCVSSPSATGNHSYDWITPCCKSPSVVPLLSTVVKVVHFWDSEEHPTGRVPTVSG